MAIDQHLLLGVIALGNRRAVGWIFHDQPLLDRHVKGFVKHHVDASDHAVGKGFAVDRMLTDATFLLDLVVEFLHLGGGQGGERFAPDEGLDLIADQATVRLQRAFAQGEHHIFVHPFVQPLAQRDARFFRKVNVAVGLQSGVQELQGLLLCLGEDRFVHRAAVLLVTDDESSLPSPIRAFAYRTVTLRSAFICHIFSSFL